jgi:hypothetical protein
MRCRISCLISHNRVVGFCIGSAMDVIHDIDATNSDKAPTGLLHISARLAIMRQAINISLTNPCCKS